MRQSEFRVLRQNRPAAPAEEGDDAKQTEISRGARRRRPRPYFRNPNKRTFRKKVSIISGDRRSFNIYIYIYIKLPTVAPIIDTAQWNVSARGPGVASRKLEEPARRRLAAACGERCPDGGLEAGLGPTGGAGGPPGPLETREAPVWRDLVKTRISKCTKLASWSMGARSWLLGGKNLVSKCTILVAWSVGARSGFLRATGCMPCTDYGLLQAGTGAKGAP